MLDIARLLQLAGLNESYLLDEGKKEELIAQQQEQKILAAYHEDRSANKPHFENALALVQHISDETDPKLIVRVMQWYVNKNLKLSDLPHLKEMLADFARPAVKAELKNIGKPTDVGQIPTYTEFSAIMAQMKEAAPKSSTEKKADVKVWVDTPNFYVWTPLTKEAAQETAGFDTKWCTAARDNNRFDQYSKDGTLYDIALDGGHKKGDKFQLHMEKNEFKNSEDIEINADEIKRLSSHPEYKQFLEFLIDKYYK